MARSYKCDNCGAEFSVRPAIRMSMKPFSVTTIVYTTTSRSQVADLCVECLQKLMKTMRIEGGGK